MASGGRSKRRRDKDGTGALAVPAESSAALEAAASVAAPRDPHATAPGALPLDPSFLDALPAGTARTRSLALLALFALVQIAIPLRYYLGGDLYDERFAWRMFSAVRVQECDVAVSETRGGREVALRPMTFLPAPWVGLLERSRPAVVRGFLDWRCTSGLTSDEGAPDAVSVRSACIDASGDPLPDVVRTLSCEGRAYEERTLGGAAADAEASP